MQRDHSRAGLRERLRLVQVRERVVRDLPSFDLATVETGQDFIGRDLEHAIDLTKIAREAYKICLNQRRTLTIDLRASDLALLPTF